MRLILVRHGDAHAGLRGVIAGPKGCRGLTDLGRHQARRLRDHLASTAHLEVDVLVTSLIPRAIETADIIAPALGIDEIPRDCDLCEVHTGEADGWDWDDWEAEHGRLDMAAEPDRAFAPGGDSLNGFNERVHRAINRLAREHEGKTVVAVCHAGVRASSMRMLFTGFGEGSGVRLVPTNTGLTEWEFSPESEQWTLRYYNDAAHLLTGATESEK